MLKPTGTANFITSPPIHPEYPDYLELPNGSTIPTRDALPLSLIHI